MNRKARSGSAWRWVVLAVVVVGAAWATWHKQVRDQMIPRNFGVVEEGAIYRSGRLTARATRLVHERHAIKTIIDLGAYDKDPVKNENAQRTAEALGVTRYEFRLIGDGTGNPNAYVAALRVMMDPANHPMLVHCAAGSERTSGATMLYLKAVHGSSFVETYPRMMDNKHDPRKNPLLMSYLADHGDAILDALRRGTFIPGHAALVMEPAVSSLAMDQRTRDAGVSVGDAPAVNDPAP